MKEEAHILVFLEIWGDSQRNVSKLNEMKLKINWQRIKFWCLVYINSAYFFIAFSASKTLRVEILDSWYARSPSFRLHSRFPRVHFTCESHTKSMEVYLLMRLLPWHNFVLEGQVARKSILLSFVSMLSLANRAGLAWICT